MYPKEKAKELLDIYLNLTKRSLDIEGWFYDIDIAQQCALIDVNNTIKALEEHQWQNIKVIDYYKLVRQEIEKI